MHDARDDHADAALIVDVAAAWRRWRGRTNKGPATKILRETVWFYWQNPRLERPRVAGKYPRGVPWSEAAASLVVSGVARNDRLVIEHSSFGVLGAEDAVVMPGAGGAGGGGLRA